MALAETLLASLPGMAGLLVAGTGMMAQLRRNSPENIAALKQRIDAAESRANVAEQRATDLAGKVDGLQDKLLDTGGLLFNAQSILVQQGLMTREQLENPESTMPVVGGT